MLKSITMNTFILFLVSSLIINSCKGAKLLDGLNEAKKPAKINTPEGDAVIDPKTGEILPEEFDDGELEGGDHHVSWSYSDQEKWAIEYPLCKGFNMRQSPIDIVIDAVITKDDARLEFIDWNQPVEFQFKNTHHSISVLPRPSLAIPSVKVSWIDDAIYELKEIHFHWGDGIMKGSEHEINGQRAAAEMHMVHYKIGIDKADIGNVENSVLVIGVLIESDTLGHNKLESLVDSAAYINGTDAEYICKKPSTLINLLPDHYNSFYTYNGSLTTPPCYEVVTWVVMSQPVFLDHERLIELTNIEAENPHGRVKIASNHRDVQPLLDRPVYVSFNISSSVSVRPNKSGRFKNVFNQYWNDIQEIKTSIRRTYRNVRDAQGNLLSKFRTLSPI